MIKELAAHLIYYIRHSGNYQSDMIKSQNEKQQKSLDTIRNARKPDHSHCWHNGCCGWAPCRRLRPKIWSAPKVSAVDVVVCGKPLATIEVTRDSG